MSKRASTKNEAPPVTAAMGGVFLFPVGIIVKPVHTRHLLKIKE
jgi:hypothetical protein